MTPHNRIILIGFLILPFICLSQKVTNTEPSSIHKSPSTYKTLIDCSVLSSTSIYVDSSAVNGLQSGLSWDDAFIDLSTALRSAKVCPGRVDSILVGKGTYYPQDSLGFCLQNL